MKKSILYLLVFVLIQFFVSRAVYSLWLLATGNSPEYVIGALTGTKPFQQSAAMVVTGSAACSIITLLLFLWRRWTVMSPAWMRMRQWDVLFWSAIASLGTLLPSMGLQELLPSLPDALKETFKLIMGNQFGYVVLCLLAPFVEEMAFRGAILRALLGCMKSRWIAITISAVLFALVHLNPAQMPHALLVGLLLGWMYQRTGSILSGVVLHWMNNTVAYMITVLIPQADDMTLTQLFGGDTVRVLLAITFSLCILLPAIFQLNLRMKKC